MSQEQRLGRGEESYYGNQIYPKDTVWDEAPDILAKHGLLNADEVVTGLKKRGWFLTLEQHKEDGNYSSQAPFVCVGLDFSENGRSNRRDSFPGRSIKFRWGKGQGIEVGVEVFLGIGDVSGAHIQNVGQIAFVDGDIVISSSKESPRAVSVREVKLHGDGSMVDTYKYLPKTP